MNTIKSFLWKTFFLLFMLICLVAYFFIVPFKLILSKKKYRRLIHAGVSFWGRVTVRSTGSRVIIEGAELIPASESICYIGNHQGLFDIPSFLGFIGKPVGFVAKQELFKVPILSLWMKEIPCVFIDRKNARKAMETFKASAGIIRGGHPLVIFPEGTRSKSDTMGIFHLGSLKLPQMADATIVPFVIKGSWRILEIDKKIHKSLIRIKILPPILPTDPIYRDKHKLSEFLHSTIKSNLETI
ncbi:MAG: lysophospholipid acyltransferase family protein [Candidatus Cloacimonadaceae bacterium]|nr:lysophospholipid acyltransferase family protein [Candidatus Cloacimonadaceae bacterium]